MINEFNKSTFSLPKLANKTLTNNKYYGLTVENPSWLKDQTNWQWLGKSHC